MDVENKLDEDFLFYLGFINGLFVKITNPCMQARCRAWLEILCGETWKGVEKKRNRNIFLSNLVLCMQDGVLVGPFESSPHEVDLSNAAQYFGVAPSEIQQPDWFQDVIERGGGAGGGDGARSEEAQDIADGGRTYVATRCMPGGEGAFAYVAITLAEDEPKWLGGEEGAFDVKMQQKFAEYCPPQTEMERVLARRKDPVERQKVLTFYDALLHNIGQEMDGEVEAQDNDTVNDLMEQLVDDLKGKGQWAPYEQMEEAERRMELLLVLYDRIHARREKVAKREEYLDDVAQKTMPASFWEYSVQPEDKFELPAAMWEQAINKAPLKRHMELLQTAYPLSLIEKFLDLLANQKEEIAMRMQKRHENIVAQMRKELRREGEKGNKKMEEAQLAYDQAMAVLKAVREARTRQAEAEAKIPKRKKGGVTAKSQLYDEMRRALLETYKNVEDEAAKGRFLSDQINNVNEQTEIYQQVNDESIVKAEENNMAIMRNIKRLQAAIKQNQGTLLQLQTMAQAKANQASSSQSTMFFF